MLFQFPDGTPEWMMIIPGVVVGLLLGVARVVKNLPKDTFKNFFEYRTKVNEIIAGDTKGRVAAAQKYRFVFMGFVLACVAVVTLAIVLHRGNGATTMPEPQHKSSQPSQAPVAGGSPIYPPELTSGSEAAAQRP
ncbi:hypothetical protein ACFV2N_18725 [Streptomyces sp. NPDC059680]|uniref:hypothetical protein n=1 Tax=Streptomyces sp. NPDC059680 TaxID=3346904 RepID=UPI00367449CA